MADVVIDLEAERTDREETDPQIRLDRLQLQVIAERLGLLEKQNDVMMKLLRAVAKKVGALED